MSLQDVAVAFAALVAVGAALYYLFKWQPGTKPWCVVLYHVSRDTNATFKWPGPNGALVNELDLKLDEVIGKLDKLPCANPLAFVKTKLLGGVSAAPEGVDWEDVHVVYRAVWNSQRPAGKRMRARVVTWRPGAPTKTDDESFATTTEDDRDGFIRWVSDNFKADHYALFFWGHSIGPGGLFELKNSVAFPPFQTAAGLTPSSLADVATTLQILQDLREGKSSDEIVRDVNTLSQSGSPVPPSGGAPSPGGGSPSSGALQTSGVRKADVVLFQDCWMATLETAFELQDLARYVVGSQSLVPIGYSYTGGVMSAPTGPVWPYQPMIGRLLAQPTDFIDALSQDLKVFYADSAARAPFPAAFVSVLDLGATDEIATNVKPGVRALVAALSMISSVPNAKILRQILFGGGSAYGPLPLIADLEYGDWALRDVVSLCEFLKLPQNHPPGLGAASPAVAAAAGQILDALKGTSPNSYSLVKNTFCEPPGALNPFKGISIMWMPDRRATIPAGDEFLGKQVDPTFYRNLRLVTNTIPTPSSTVSWATFAFEQLT